MFVDDVSVLAAVIAGFLLFFTPCVLPLVPAYLGYISGISIAKSASKWERLLVLSHAILFTLGFSAVFVVLGASIGFVGFAIRDQTELLRYVFGSLLICFGLFMTGIFKIPFLMREWRPPISFGEKAGFLRSFAVGAAFALAWTPCVGPVLGAILTFAYSSATAAKGAFLLSVFSLGLAIPFVLSAVFLNAVLGFFKKLQKYTRVVEVLSGAFLIFLGVLVITNYLETLNSMLPFSNFTWN